MSPAFGTLPVSCCVALLYVSNSIHQIKSVFTSQGPVIVLYCSLVGVFTIHIKPFNSN